MGAVVLVSLDPGGLGADDCRRRRVERPSQEGLSAAWRDFPTRSRR
jgi:hypothetical protein